MNSDADNSASADLAPLRVESLKFDGKLHRAWTTSLVERKGELIVLEGTFDEDVSHPLLGEIARGTRSVEYYWTDRWYSVFRFEEPYGVLRNYYCNINCPVSFDGSLLSFKDLDIDVLVKPDFSYEILDLEEFEANAKIYRYEDDLRAKVFEALNDLLTLIERRAFPFAASLK